MGAMLDDETPIEEVFGGIDDRPLSHVESVCRLGPALEESLIRFAYAEAVDAGIEQQRHPFEIQIPQHEIVNDEVGVPARSFH